MIIEKAKDQKYQPGYGILMSAPDFQERLAQSVVGAAYGTISPMGETTAHRHDEYELFVILSGVGLIRIGDRDEEVGPGDTILMEPFDLHSLRCCGADEVSFFTMFWREADLSARLVGERRTATDEVVFVASTPPTPNGDLHLGHIAGPYLGADTHCRYLRMRGVSAYHITGSDDYQSYTVAKAEALGIDPQQTADHFSDQIIRTLNALDIHVDKFTRSSREDGYHDAALGLLQKLKDVGAVKWEPAPALVDGDTGRYLYEVDVTGLCPVCGVATSGNICEECGNPNLCTDLVNPIAKRSGKSPLVENVAQYRFQLSKYMDHVRRHHASAQMSARLRTLIESVSARDVRSVAISHPGDWGVPVGADGPAGQTLWAWFEMVASFLISIRNVRAANSAGQPALEMPQDARIVHFFGYDNSFYHTILFPAILSAGYPGRVWNIDYVYNEFYLLEGLKFSTSRNHAVWSQEILARASVDEIRYFLAFSRPENRREDFTWVKFADALQRHLLDEWDAWIVDLSNRVEDDFGGVAPETGVWTLEQCAFFGLIKSAGESVARCYESQTYSLQRATRLLNEFVRECRRFAMAERHWREHQVRRSEYRTAAALELAAVRHLALLARPIMPNFAARILGGLGAVQSEAETWPEYPVLPEAGRRVSIRTGFRGGHREWGGDEA
jgi:methionyl-tRNA synthetase